MNIALRKSVPPVLLDASLWIAYFLLLTVIALPQGLNTSLHGAGLGAGNGIKVLSSVAELKAMFGFCDAGSYINGAEDILVHGVRGLRWYYNLWAPGFFWLQAIGLAIFGAKLKVALYLCLLNNFCWSAAFFFTYAVCKRVIQPWLAALLPLVLLSFPFMHGYFISGEGVFMTEPISAAFYTLALLFLLQAIFLPLRWKAFSLAAGVAFAASSYLRASMDIVITVSILTFVVWSIFLAWQKCRGLERSNKSLFVVQFKFWLIGTRLKWFLRKPKNSQAASMPLSSLWKSIFVSLLVFQCLTIPWRLHNLHYRGDMQWIRIDYYWKNLFMRNEDFPPADQWYVMGAAPVACYCNLKLCDAMREARKLHGDNIYSAKDYQLAAVKLFIRHPLKWIKYKLERIGPYWFSQPSVTVPGNFDLSNVLILILAVAGLIMSVKTVKTEPGKILLWLFVSFVLAQCLSGAFLHFEVRYFYGIKVFFILFALLQAAFFFSKRPNSATL